MPQITLILHNIRSTHNIGSIFRSAEGFGVSEIILSGYSPYPRQSVVHSDIRRLPHLDERITGQIHKTALGAEEMVPSRYVSTLDEAFALTKSLPLYALEQAKTSYDIRTVTVDTSFALLVGEEVHGIDESILQECDKILEISMHGQKESFNVAVATGIALFALTK